MRQDARASNAVKILPDSINPRSLKREQVESISQTIILHVAERDNNAYPDYLETEGMLISEKLKKIMVKYQPDAIFRTIVLIERKINRQEAYYLISPPVIECASSETAYDMQGNVKEFVLDEVKAGSARVFCDSKCGSKIFVRLDVAESIMRREPYGVLFERVVTGNRVTSYGL